MATAADSSSSATATATTTRSPRFRRNSRNNLSSPWSHVARSEPEGIPATAAAPPSPSPPSPSAGTGSSPNPSYRSPPKAAATAAESPPDSDNGGNGNAAAVTPGKKQAWNRPSNGSIETGPVMGAVSWPALSEATKSSTKSSSSDPVKVHSDGSVSAPPVLTVPSPPPKPATDIPSPSSSTNHAAPARQKSMKRGGGSGNNNCAGANSGSGALANSGQQHPPISAEIPQIAPVKPVGTEPSPRDVTNRSNDNWDHGARGGGFSPHPHGGNEHHRVYGGNRRGKNGGGGGPHHGNYGNRDRVSYEWNHRNFGGGRDVQLQQPPLQQRTMPRPYLRPPPPGTGPFITSPPVRPFGGPLSFPDMTPPVYYVSAPPPPESLRGVPFVAPPAMFFGPPGPPDSQLHTMLAKQIEYYFSSENLCKDIYLRQNMDEEGWVSISLIANFNRVKQLTNSIQFILDTVRNSAVVEVQGDKIRRRNDWMNWLLAPSPNQSQSSTSLNYDILAAHMSSVGLEEGTSGQNNMRPPAYQEALLSRSSSGEFNGTIAYGDESTQSTTQTSSDRAVLARSLSRSDTF